MNSNERNCDKCVYGRRSGNCTAWNCKGTVTVEDIKAETIDECIDVIMNTYSTYNDTIHDIVNELRKVKGNING